jgi:hypothetical protein
MAANTDAFYPYYFGKQNASLGLEMPCAHGCQNTDTQIRTTILVRLMVNICQKLVLWWHWQYLPATVAETKPFFTYSTCHLSSLQRHVHCYVRHLGCYVTTWNAAGCWKSLPVKMAVNEETYPYRQYSGTKMEIKLIAPLSKRDADDRRRRRGAVTHNIW